MDKNYKKQREIQDFESLFLIYIKIYFELKKIMVLYLKFKSFKRGFMDKELRKIPIFSKLSGSTINKLEDLIVKRNKKRREILFLKDKK